MSACNVRLVDHPLLGQSACAARAFKEGEVVLRQQPLLELPEAAQACTAEMRARCRLVLAAMRPNETAVDEDSLDATCVRYALSFAAAPAGVQQEILRTCFSPPFDATVAGTLAGAAAARAAAAVATLLAREQTLKGSRSVDEGEAGEAQGSECGDKGHKVGIEEGHTSCTHPHGTQLGQEGESSTSEPAHQEKQIPKDPHPQLTEATLLRALLAIKANAFSHTLFPVACKLAHSCGEANTRFTRRGTEGLVIALQDIKEGEVLSICYLEAKHALASVPYRRRELLQRLLFVCQCSSCRAVDLFRALPCPLCVPRGPGGLLEDKHALGGEPLGGVITRDAEQEAREGGPWTCSSCGSCFPDDQAALFGAAGADALLKASAAKLASMPGSIKGVLGSAEEVMEWAVMNRAHPQPHQVVEAHAELARLLGPAHWATLYVLRAAICVRASTNMEDDLPLIQAGVQQLLAFQDRISQAGSLTMQRQLFFGEGLMEVVQALQRGISDLPAEDPVSLRMRALATAQRVLQVVEAPLEMTRLWDQPLTAGLTLVSMIKEWLAYAPPPGDSGSDDDSDTSDDSSDSCSDADGGQPGGGGQVSLEQLLQAMQGQQLPQGEAAFNMLMAGLMQMMGAGAGGQQQQQQPQGKTQQAQGQNGSK